jgi:hypothetical protein
MKFGHRQLTAAARGLYGGLSGPGKAAETCGPVGASACLLRPGTKSRLTGFAGAGYRFNAFYLFRELLVLAGAAGLQQNELRKFKLLVINCLITHTA